MIKPTVQIIIPVYNAERYLRRCLDSVREQKFEAWQAFLINDASKDRSLDIIEEYVKKDKRFLLIDQKENGGASRARNTALDALGAKYVAFLDSDDTWEKDMLQTLVDVAEKNGSDVVQARYMYDFEGGKRIVPKGAFGKDVTLEGKDLRKVYIKMMTGINMNHVCMKLIRTDLVKVLRFDEALKTAEDLKFSVELFKKVKKYDFVDKILYHYYRNENSLTGKGLGYKVKLDANRRVSECLVEALPTWGMDNAFYRSLSRMRPYTIMLSKIQRMVCEKMFSER